RAHRLYRRRCRSRRFEPAAAQRQRRHPRLHRRNERLGSDVHARHQGDCQLMNAANTSNGIVEALPPRDQRLERAAQILRRAAYINGAIAAGGLVLALIAGLRVIPDLFEFLQRVLLIGYAGNADTALALAILLALVNVSLLLVLT